MRVRYLDHHVEVKAIDGTRSLHLEATKWREGRIGSTPKGFRRFTWRDSAGHIWEQTAAGTWLAKNH